MLAEQSELHPGAVDVPEPNSHAALMPWSQDAEKSSSDAWTAMWSGDLNRRTRAESLHHDKRVVLQQAV
jgi:hypothetical protein